MTKTDVLAIIQARMASSRLPGKILMKLDQTPLIGHIIDRARSASNVDEVVLATSDNKADDPVEVFCREAGAECFRGSEEDVLARFIGAAEKFNPKYVVRLCGDQPIFDINLLEQMIDEHIKSGADFSISTNNVPKGLNLEIITYDVLKKAGKEAKTLSQREHVSKFILDNAQRFKIRKVGFSKDISRPDIVLTVDTKEDFEFVKKIYFALKKKGKHKGSSTTAKEIIDIIDSKSVSRKPIILLRADGSKEKGIGDLVALMNLVEPLREDYECIFASKDYAEGIDYIKNNGYEVLCLSLKNNKEEDIKMIREFCNTRNIRYCLVDLYPNDADYVKELSSFLKTLMIDFHGGIDVHSDILLYWDLFSDKLKYNFLNKETLKLFGPEYVPLRKSILRYQRKSNNKELKKITVSFGGSDRDNLSFVLLDALSSLDEKHDFTYLVGPGFKDIDKFKEKTKNKKIQVIYSSKNIYDIFSKSDLVISGGGLTSFELCALGVPFIGISKASWEITRLKKMETLGICRFIAVDKELKDNLLHQLKELSDLNLRDKMSSKGKELVDGKGASRIADIIRSRWVK